VSRFWIADFGFPEEKSFLEGSDFSPAINFQFSIINSQFKRRSSSLRAPQSDQKRCSTQSTCAKGQSSSSPPR
jgi:hypothetical protein